MMVGSPSSFIHPFEGERRLNSAMMPDGEAERALRMERFGSTLSAKASSTVSCQVFGENLLFLSRHLYAFVGDDFF